MFTNLDIERGPHIVGNPLDVGQLWSKIWIAPWCAMSFFSIQWLFDGAERFGAMIAMGIQEFPLEFPSIFQMESLKELQTEFPNEMILWVPRRISIHPYDPDAKRGKAGWVTGWVAGMMKFIVFFMYNMDS